MTIRTSVQREKRYRTVIALLSGALLIALVVASVSIFSNFGKTSAGTDGGQTTVKKTEVSLSGKTADEDRKDALNAAASLLNAGNKYNGDLSFEDRVKKVENGDKSVADFDGMDKGLLFAGDFENNSDLKTSTYQTIITLAHYLKTDGSKEIAPVSDSAADMVYLDQAHGIAYIPVNALSSTTSIFSLEMVYDNGQWKLSPYTLLDMVRMSYAFSSSSSGGK